MVEILNNLPDFCEDCEYLQLVHYETLGSGKHAFTCKHLYRCMRLQNVILEQIKKKETQKHSD